MDRCPRCHCPVLDTGRTAAGHDRILAQDRHLLLEPEPGGPGQLGIYAADGTVLPIEAIAAGRGYHRHTCKPEGCPDHDQPSLF